MINGGIQPTADVSGNCGNGAGKTCTPVDTAHFTLTTGKSLSGDPPNGYMVQATVNANNTASSGHTYLTVDSVAQYPILAHNDNCPGTDIGAGNLFNGENTVFAFTNAINGCTGGSITKGWRAFSVVNNSQGSPVTYPGMINQILHAAALNCANVLTYGAGIPMIAYEGGQTFVASGTTASPFVIALTNVMRDARMGYVYEQLYNRWKNLTGGCSTGVFVQFDDIEPITLPSTFEWWGLLENVLNTSSPRYDATINFTKGNPGGRLNILFNRDLDPPSPSGYGRTSPASNDNEPVGLPKTA